MKSREERRYTDFNDDFAQTAKQDYALPEDYRFVRTDFGSRLLSALIYGAALAFSAVVLPPCAAHARAGVQLPAWC